MIFLFYHAACFDGYMANVIGLNSSESTIKPFGVSPGPNLLKSMEIILKKEERPSKILVFDVSLGPEVYAMLQLYSDTVYIFDHHETTQFLWRNECPMPANVYINVQMAGCEIAWQYFCPHLPVPEPVRLIGNRDTWRVDYTENHNNAQELAEAIYSVYHPSGSPKRWIELLDDEKWQELRPTYLLLGKQLIKSRRNRVKSVCQNKRLKKVFFGPNEQYFVATVNSPCDQSFIGEYLLSMSSVDFVVIWCYNGDKKSYKVSLRSARFDVSKIALKFQGGGHATAAGYEAKNIDIWL